LGRSATTGTPSAHIASPSTRNEAATTAVLFETSTALTRWAAITTATSHASARVVRIGAWAQAALLDVDLLAADLVWVGGNGSLETGRSSEVDKGAVLIG